MQVLPEEIILPFKGKKDSNCIRSRTLYLKKDGKVLSYSWETNYCREDSSLDEDYDIGEHQGIFEIVNVENDVYTILLKFNKCKYKENAFSSWVNVDLDYSFTIKGKLNELKLSEEQQEWLCKNYLDEL